MESIEEIFVCLASDKVMVRKKGKESCDRFILTDKKILQGNSRGILNLFNSVVDYVDLEIARFRKIEKEAGDDVSNFFKAVVKYCSSLGQIHPSAVNILLQHISYILADLRLSTSFRVSYRSALCELLESCCCLSSTAQTNSEGLGGGLLKVMSLLKASLQDKRSLEDSTNHRLLKLTFRALRLEDGRKLRAGLIEQLLRWLNLLLGPEVVDWDTSHAYPMMVGTVADCLESVIPLFAFDHPVLLHRHIEPALQASVKLLATQQSNDLYRESCARLVCLYMQVSRSYTWQGPVESRLFRHALPLQRYFPVMAEVLTTDSHVKGLLNTTAYSGSTTQRARNPSGNKTTSTSATASLDEDRNFRGALVDRRVRAGFQVVAEVFLTAQLTGLGLEGHYFSCATSPEYAAGPTQQPQKRRRSSTPPATFFYTQRTNTDKNLTAVDTDGLKDELRSFLDTHLTLRIEQTAVSLGGTKGTPLKSLASHVQLELSNIQLLESLFLTLSILCILCPGGDFLFAEGEFGFGPESLSHSSHYMVQLRKLDRLLRLVSAVELQVMNVARVSVRNPQLVDALLSALLGLMRLSHTFAHEGVLSSVDADSNGFVGPDIVSDSRSFRPPVLTEECEVHCSHRRLALRQKWTSIGQVLLAGIEIAKTAGSTDPWQTLCWQSVQGLFNNGLWSDDSLYTQRLWWLRWVLTVGPCSSTALEGIPDIFSLQSDSHWSCLRRACSILGGEQRRQWTQRLALLCDECLKQCQTAILDVAATLLAEDSCEFTDDSGVESDYAASNSLTALFANLQTPPPGGANRVEGGVTPVFVVLWLLNALSMGDALQATQTRLQTLSAALTSDFSKISVTGGPLLKHSLGALPGLCTAFSAFVYSSIAVDPHSFKDIEYDSVEDTLGMLSYVSVRTISLDLFSSYWQQNPSLDPKRNTPSTRLHGDSDSRAEAAVLAEVEAWLSTLQQIHPLLLHSCSTNKADGGQLLGVEAVLLLLFSCYGALCKVLTTLSPPEDFRAARRRLLAISARDQALCLLPPLLTIQRNRINIGEDRSSSSATSLNHALSVLDLVCPLLKSVLTSAHEINATGFERISADKGFRAVCVGELRDLLGLIRKMVSRGDSGAAEENDLEVSPLVSVRRSSGGATSQVGRSNELVAPRDRATSGRASEGKRHTSGGGRRGVSMKFDSDDEEEGSDGYDGFDSNGPGSPLPTQKCSRRWSDGRDSFPAAEEAPSVFKLSFSDTTLGLLAAVAQCSFLLDSYCMKSTQDLITTLRGQGLEEGLETSTDPAVVLALTHHLAVFCPTFLSPTHLFSLLEQCDWLTELGAVGYQKVLHTVLAVTDRESFWELTGGTVDLSDTTDTTVPGADAAAHWVRLVLVGARRISLETLALSSSLVRRLQLEAVAVFMRRADIQQAKQEVIPLFLGAVVDADLCVRLTAARHMSLLFKHFKNHAKVYSALMTAAEVSFSRRSSSVPSKGSPKNSLSDLDFDLVTEEEEGSSEDPLLVFSVAVSLGQMARASEAVRPHALFDLMRLCVSRRELELKVSLFALDYLLSRIVSAVAWGLGYSDPAALVRDYSLWLLSNWLSPARHSPSNSLSNDEHEASQLRSSHLLSTFPFHLLDSGAGLSCSLTRRLFLRDIVSWSRMLHDEDLNISSGAKRKRTALTLSLDAVGDRGAFCFALKAHVHTLLPLIAFGRSPGVGVAQTKELLDFVGRTLGEKPTAEWDSQTRTSEAILGLIHSKLWCLTAFTALMYEDSDSLVATLMGTLEISQMDALEVSQHLQTRVSDLVKLSLNLLTLHPPAEECVTLRDYHARVKDLSSLEGREALIISLLLRISRSDKADTTREDSRLQHLLSTCNPLDTLASLRVRLTETRSEASSANIAVAAGVVAGMSPLALAPSLLPMALDIFRITSDVSPDVLMCSCWALGRLSDKLVGRLKAGRTEFTSASTERVNWREVEDCALPLLFSHLLVCFERLQRSFSDPKIFDNDCVIRFCDSYVGLPIAGNTDDRVERSLRRVIDGLRDSLVRLLAYIQEQDSPCLQSLVPAPSLFPLVDRHIELALFLDCELDVSSHIKNCVRAFSRHLLGSRSTLALIWLQTLTLKQVLSNGTTDTEVASAADSLWMREPQLTAQLVSCMLSMAKCLQHTSTFAPTGAVQETQSLLLLLVGGLGSPLARTLDQQDFPAAIGHPWHRSDYCENIVRKKLLRKVLGLLTIVSGDVEYQILSSTLGALSTCSYPETKQLWATADSESGEEESWIATMRSFQSTDPGGHWDWVEGHLQQIFQRLTLRHGAPPKRSSESGANTQEGTYLDPWDRDVWSTEGKSYAAWVATLTFHLISRTVSCTPVVSFEDQNNVSDMNSASGDWEYRRAEDEFLWHMRGACLIDPEVAESVFPLVVALVLSNNALVFPVRHNLTRCFQEHLLCAVSSSMAAARLGCRTLVFLLRTGILLSTHQSADTATSPFLTATDGSGSAGQVLPFSYALEIPYREVAEAASRCRLFCCAMLFVELSQCHALAVDPVAAVDGPAENIKTYGRMIQNRKSFLGNKNPRGVEEALVPTKLLLPIYRALHDADAIFGVDLSSDLELQAAQYAHEGRWMEALSAYECVLQAHTLGLGRGACSDEALSGARLGVVQALGGLGATTTLGLITSGNSHPDEQSFSLTSWSGQLMRSDPAVAETQGFDASLLDLQNAIGSGSPLLSSYHHIRANEQWLLTRLAETLHDESAHAAVSLLGRTQRLVETKEALDAVSKGTSGLETKQHIQQLLRNWQQRPSASLNPHSVSRSQLLQRSTLLLKMLRTGGLSVHQALRCFNSSCSMMMRSREQAQAGSGVAYQFWNSLQETLSTDPVYSSTNSHTTTLISTGTRSAGKASAAVDKGEEGLNEEGIVVRASLLLQECRLLWTKGWGEAAVSRVSQTVVSSLERVLLSCKQRRKAQRGATANNEAATIASSVGFDLEPTTANLLSEALRTGGDWLVALKASTGSDILADFFHKAAQVAVGEREIIQASRSLALFHARLYESLQERVDSPEWGVLARSMVEREEEYRECTTIFNAERQRLQAEKKRLPKGHNPDTTELVALQRHMKLMQKDLESERAERQSVEASLDKHLQQALRHFAKVLQLSASTDMDCVFRLVSLWLANERLDHINQLMGQLLQVIPTDNFVPLSYQLLSRLGAEPSAGSDPPRPAAKQRTFVDCTGDDDVLITNDGKSSTGGNNPSVAFQKVLAKLVLRIGEDHPYHILPQLLALTQTSGGQAVEIQSSRLQTAVLLVQQLKKSQGRRGAALSGGDTLEAVVHATQHVLNEYITLANTGTEAFQKAKRTSAIKFTELPVPASGFAECLKRHAVRPAVLTVTVPVRRDLDYRDTTRLMHVAATFDITDSGLSRPKIIRVLGSDGVRRRELVKGGDDIRQDAVMQQVFALVNHMLAQDPDTRERKLCVRTYKCVPTTAQTGVLEWVEHTAAFGHVLTHPRSGAHGRYRPQDWTNAQCREHFLEAVDIEDRHKRLVEIYAHFHPAFKFFFLERFPEPSAWLSARWAFTRSVAANSMVGYILGIGDRHAQNILVDTVTAEVVHIDFGIVFEQGKTLPTPETVPFRLTRDMVDGMALGVPSAGASVELRNSGCEGTFRRGCEETLRVLRENQLQILTILEVVIHDPLYKWALTSLQLRTRQKPPAQAPTLVKQGSRAQRQQTAPVQTVPQGPEAGAPMSYFSRDAAQKTLQRVRQKLVGMDSCAGGGTVGGEALAVKGQVELLLQEARAPKNLSRLYHGWTPWL